MVLTKEEINELRQYKVVADSDDIRFKEIIKKKLLNNKKIIYVLNNKKLEKLGAEADEYFNVNILPFYMIPETQTDVQNFICYEIQFEEVHKYKNILKYGQIVFTILCEQKGLFEKTTGFARHDLLAALILEEFNWCNSFGMQIHCISDKPSVVDSDYACRTLIFEMETLNGIAKTIDGKPKIINNEVNL